MAIRTTVHDLHRTLAKLEPVRDPEGGSGDATAELRARIAQQERKETVMRENIAFERTCHVSCLSEGDFAEHIGTYWRTQRPAKLDFSSARYRLETLGSNAGPVELRGLLHPQLHRGNLKHLDVSYNMLPSINMLTVENGFSSLNILMARQNLLWNLDIALPKLIELNIAENNLTSVPILTKCPMLEHLIFSHNRLSVGLENVLECKRLKRLDLAHNQINCRPSDLDRYLKHWAQLRSLGNLRLEKNPFTTCFKEYQVFVISALPLLYKIDDVEITNALRTDIKAMSMYDLSSYDHIFNQRQQEALASETMGTKKKAAVQRFPRLVRLVAQLEEMYEDPGSIHENVRFVRELAMNTCRFQSEDFEGFDLQAFFWTPMDSNQEMEHPQAAVSHFLELVVGLMERHDSIRRTLVETLALLSGVVRHGLGVKCMASLGRMMLTSEAYRADVEAALNRVLVPVLLELSGGDLRGDTAGNIVFGLVELMKNRRCKFVVARALQDLVPLIVACLKKRTTFTESAMMLKLLASATEYEPSMEANQSEELLQRCVAAIDDRSISENENHRGMWLDLLRFTQQNIRVGDDKILSIVTKSALHVNLISKAKKLWSTLNMSEALREARTLATMLNLVTTMMQKRVDILRDCCGPYKLDEFCCAILKTFPADPMVLAAACEALTVALRDPPTCASCIGSVVDELAKVRPLLQFLGGKKYPDLYRRSMLHEAAKDSAVPDSNDAEEADDGVPTFAVCDVAADALLAIINLIAFFAENGDDDSTEVGAQIQLVNYYLNDANRERILLKLLVMENDDVRLSVMRCISKVSLNEIEPEEMGLILKRLAATKDVGAGNEEEILALVVQQLERFAGSNEPSGQHFRQNLAEVAVAEAYEVLLMNSKRATYGGEEEEQQKSQLSAAIVGLFITCSKFPSLRKQLRNLHISETLPQIMKFEEELNSPMAADVCLEQTWSGRSLENLMDCLSGPKRLDRRKKVALRVICRIADIAEGATDGLRGVEQPYTSSLQDLCSREEGMWNAQAVRRSLRFLDDQEWRDRAEQLERFAGRNGLSCIMHFLYNDQLEEKRSRYAQQLAAAKRKLSQIQTASESRLADIEQAELDERERIDAAEMKLEEDVGNAYYKATGRDVMMIAVQQCEDAADGDAQTLFAAAPGAFVEADGLHEDVDEGVMQRAYPLSAFLRMIFALLIVPPSEERREEVVRELRDPKVVMQLLALVEDVPPLCCQVAAKFLRVMAHVLDLSTFSMENAPFPLEILYVLSMYCTGLAEHCLGALRLARDSVLSLREQTLCMELSRLQTVLISTAPLFRYSKHADVQRLATTDVIDWLVPSVVIRFVVAVVIYDLQLDHGGGERNKINDSLVALHRGKLGMKDYATQFLSRLLVRCPQHKYDVLEVFSVSDIFLHQYVRPSYLMELLTAMTMGKYMCFVETSFLNLRPGYEEERILCYGLAEGLASTRGASGTTATILCCTTRGVYLLAPSEQLPPYADKDTIGVRWEPGWESVFPREPSILWEREYLDIATCYRCYGAHTMALEFKAGKEIKKQDNTGHSPHELLMFHHASDLETCLECLSRCGGSGRRVQVINDPAIRAEVLAKAGDAEILAACVATRLPSSTAPASGPASDPCLFVMTMKSILQFSVNMQSWFAPDEDTDIYFDPDDPSPSGSGQTEGSTTKAAAGHPGAAAATTAVAVPGEGTPSKVGQLKAHMQRQQQNIEPVRRPKASKDKKASSVLSLVTEKALPPSEVVFETSQEAVLLLKAGGEELRIRFYDDAGREQWRRALTQYLSKHDSSWERQHH